MNLGSLAYSMYFKIIGVFAVNINIYDTMYWIDFFPYIKLECNFFNTGEIYEMARVY